MAPKDMTIVRDHLAQQRNLAMEELIRERDHHHKEEGQPQKQHDRDMPEPYLGEPSDGDADEVEYNPVVIATKEIIGIVADHPISLAVGDEPPKLYPKGTPVKVSKVTMKGWNDHMKLELLRE